MHFLTRTFPQPDAENSDSLFVQLSFSGGGTRAAALAYGVLAELERQRIRWEGRDKSLLDEVDLISAVSGGSILAAYYGLNGKQTFSSFERDFLRVDLQDELTSRILFSPANWWRLSSPRFGRSEILSELLDERLFGGATFGAFWDKPQRPRIVIAASNISTGDRFEFTPVVFNSLCSDISTFPIARGVAASSAVPVLLSPVTLWNYGLNCLRDPPPEGARLPSRYVHLLDGGLSDNLSARGTPEYIARNGGVLDGARRAGLRGVRKAVFIVVNAETAAQPTQDRSADVPGAMRTLTALVDVPINRYSSESMTRMRAMVNAWEREVRTASDLMRQDYFTPDARFYLIEVSLAAMKDAGEREHFMNVPTLLRLDPQDTQRLIEYGKDALRRSPEFSALMQDIAVEASR